MKIALIHNFFYRASGATELVLRAAVQLKKRGHAVSVYVLDAEDEVSAAFEREAIPVQSQGFREWRTNKTRFLSVLDPLLLFVNKMRAFFVFRRLKRRLEESADVVVTSHYHLTPIIHLLLTKPVIYYCHEPPRQYYEPLYGGGRAYRSLLWKLAHPLNALYGLADKRLDRFCARKASVILANSDYTRRCVEKAYGRKAKTVSPGVDADVYRNLNLKRSYVLSVGRLYLDLKGHSFVIKSVGLLPKKKPALVVVGDGTEVEKGRLRGIARECGVPLEIKSGAGSGELVSLYNGAAVAAFGYVREPFGLTALEAMACETPVVAVAEGGLQESVADAGVLTGRDERAFAEAIAGILASPEKAGRMGAAERRRVMEFFTWDGFGARLEKVLSRFATASTG